MMSTSPASSVAGVVNSLIPQDEGSGLDEERDAIPSPVRTKTPPRQEVPPPVVADTSSETIAASLKELRDTQKTMCEAMTELANNLIKRHQYTSSSSEEDEVYHRSRRANKRSRSANICSKRAHSDPQGTLVNDGNTLNRSKLLLPTMILILMFGMYWMVNSLG